MIPTKSPKADLMPQKIDQATLFDAVTRAIIENGYKATVDEIRAFMEKHFKEDFPDGRLYVIFRRMEALGMIESEKVQTKSLHGSYQLYRLVNRRGKISIAPGGAKPQEA